MKRTKEPMRTRLLVSSALLAAAAACGSSTTPTEYSGSTTGDASTHPDATSDDASGGQPEGSTTDGDDEATAPDAGDDASGSAAPDATAPDASLVDAGNGDASDAGSGPVDAAPDAAPVPSMVSGILKGLSPGESITLEDNGGDAVTLSANGAFSFPTLVAPGAPYAVTVSTPPTSPIAQKCTVARGAGNGPGTAVTNVEVDCDLIAFFPFTANASNAILDVSGYGNPATKGAAISLTNDHGGAPNGAYSFDGHGVIDAVIPAAILPAGNAARTLSAWIEPTTGENLYGLVYYGEGNCTGKMYGIALQSSDVYFWGGCADVPTTLPFPVNAWTFIAITYDGAGAMAIYLNGQAAGDASTATSSVGSLATVAHDLIIGGDLENAVLFTGNIDSVRIYGHALTPSEVQAVYTQPDP